MAVLERRAVLTGFDTQAGRFHADKPNVGVIDKIGEHADGVGAAADAGDDRIRQAAFALQHLRFGFFADHALEFTHDSRVRMRAGGGAEHIVRGFIAAGPVAQRFVAGVFQGGGAAVHRDHFRAHQPHAEHVRRLALDVFGAHIDAAFQAEQRAGQRRRDAVLACAGFRDDLGFAHALGQQRLAQHLVGLVCAAVQQVFTLQIKLGVAAGGEVFAQRQRRRAACVVL